MLEFRGLTNTGRFDQPEIPEDEPDPRCSIGFDLIESEAVPESGRQGEYMDHRASPKWYILVYGHLRPMAVPDTLFRGENTRDTRHYIPVERGPVRKSDIAADSMAGGSLVV